MTYEERMKLLKLFSKHNKMADPLLNKDYRPHSDISWKILPLQYMSPNEWKKAKYEDFL